MRFVAEQLAIGGGGAIAAKAIAMILARVAIELGPRVRVLFGTVVAATVKALSKLKGQLDESRIGRCASGAFDLVKEFSTRSFVEWALRCAEAIMVARG